MTGKPLTLSPAQVELARCIDHTVLKPDASRESLLALCAEGRRYGFCSVCVAPCWVPLAVGSLAGSGVLVAAVVGFPHGNTLAAAKAFEAAALVRAGAAELDMVLNVGALLSGDSDTARQDIEAVVKAARTAASATAPVVKVILETCYLSDEQKVAACRLAVQAGADYVKTSTGFGSGGATEHDIRLMRETVGPDIGVKASGGIRDLATARAMLAAGASRLGCSASVAIVEEAARATGS